MTSQQQLVYDSSTLANFKQWAQAISSFFTTAGWIQSTDTGQVNWSTIASVPGSGAFVYEVWKPGDGLTAFFLKIEYGNTSGTNSPGLRFSVSTTTNGAGTPTGFIIGPTLTAQTGNAPTSSSTQYECNFSGDSGRMHVMMWRNNLAVAAQQVFSIERSINGAGTYTGTYVTLIVGGWRSNTNMFAQQTLHFTLGAAPLGMQISSGAGGLRGGINVRYPFIDQTTANSAFAGSVGMDLAAPYIGYTDVALTGIGVGFGSDFTEGVTFSCTVLGSTRTYMPSKNGCFARCLPPGNDANAMLCMRYD